MKFHAARLFRRSVLLATGLLLAAALPAHASNFTLDFTDDSGGTAGVDASNTWVVLTGGAWTGNLGISGPAINVYNGTNNAAYSIAAINAAGGFNVTDIAAGRAYVFYGNNSLTNFENTTAVQPAAGTSGIRYSFTEWNYSGSGSATPDISEIDQFGGSLRLDAYAYNGTGYALSGSTYNTLATSGDAMRALLSSTGFTTTSSAVVTSGGNIISFVGPAGGNSSIESAAYVPNANTNFTTYLTHLNAINSNSWISNNLAGQEHGLNNVTYNSGNNTYFVSNTEHWLSTYSFNATVDAGGNIIMNGSVTLTGASAGTSGNIIVYNGLYMTVPAGSNLTTMIYSGTVTLPGTNNSPISFGNTSTSNITVNGVASGNAATWDGLNTYANAGYANMTLTAAQLSQINGNFGAYSLIAQLVFGDYSEGLNTGIVGNTTFASQSSGQWWSSPTNAYANLTIGNSGNYNAFGAVNFANSANTTYNISTGAVTGNVVGGAIYTGPYDDRFSSNLVYVPSLGEADVVLLPDGNMSTSDVPEPATDALFGACTVAIVTEFYRRRRHQSRRARRRNAT